MKNWILAIICLSALTAYAEQFPTGPIQQFGTTNQQTSSWKRDQWQPDKRWNAIDPKTGRKTGGYVVRDRLRPESRWNVDDVLSGKI